MQIWTEPTPNPATLKFMTGQAVMPSGTANFPTPDSAGRSPLAEALFRIAGVTGVFLGADFITVAKADEVDWGDLEPAVTAAIADHFNRGLPVLTAQEADQTAAADGADGEIIAQICELLDTRVRPAVAMDGGDIVFQGFEDGVVFLYMQGACAGCPSSTATLKMGIENMLKHYIPEVVEVRAVV